LRKSNTGKNMWTYFVGGCWVQVVSYGVAAPGMVNLLAPVMDAVMDDAGVTKGKVTLEITTNVPGTDVTVFAAAKITTSDTDRLAIGNTVNKLVDRT
jgi:hypothetical protein